MQTQAKHSQAARPQPALKTKPFPNTEATQTCSKGALAQDTGEHRQTRHRLQSQKNKRPSLDRDPENQSGNEHLEVSRDRHNCYSRWAVGPKPALSPHMSMDCGSQPSSILNRPGKLFKNTDAQGILSSVQCSEKVPRHQRFEKALWVVLTHSLRPESQTQPHRDNQASTLARQKLTGRPSPRTLRQAAT